MSMEQSLTPSTETGTLGIMHLKRYWHKSMLKRAGALPQKAFEEEWNTDNTLLAALGLGLEQTITYLFIESPTFEEFEQWVLQLHAGEVPREKVEAFNLFVMNGEPGKENNQTGNILSQDDLEHWKEHGYVIVREAVSKEDCRDTINAVCEFLGIREDDPATWYRPHPARQGIMVQMFQHPALEKNRSSKKIRAAYEQLWGRTDLWMNTDRISFNPPECEGWSFPGPRLHWDVSLELPIPFGLQGLLYLSDTSEQQGAFTLVPGFHRRIESWIHSLPPGSDPRREDLYALGIKPIAAKAGDFIIWHQALPHGSSPNTTRLPRIVQYMNYAPVDAEVRKTWI
jgi:hypothetical protein